MRDRLVTHHLPLLRQKLRDIKVIYTDLDNTLLGPRSSLFLTPDNQYSLETARALVGAMNSGIDVVLVSGRNNSQLREIARILGIENYIVELGCAIYYDQGRRMTTNYHYPVPEGQSLHDAVAASGAPAFLLEHFKGRLEYHTPWSKQQQCTHLFRGLIDVRLANSLLAAEGLADLRVVDNGRSRSLGNLAPLPEMHVYHLLPKDANKASAIVMDQQTRGFSPEQAIALGDSLADLEMAGAVGHFFLVSPPEETSSQLNGELLTYSNAFVTSKSMGLGWAEVAELLGT